MKKLAYPALIVALLATLGFVYKNYEQKKNTIPTLQNRSEKQTISTGSEWLNTKAAIENLLDQIRRHPDDIKAKLQLAMAYVQESRVTGNHAYYDEAAFKLVSQVLEKEPTNYDAMSVKTTILLSQHHFADALTAANEFVKLYPAAAFGYGLLTDANLELGNYTEAIKACDKMNAIRPDLRSYSRAAYLREIHGDYAGAKDAMLLAVKSGVPALEQTEWCRVQLGHLYEKTNDLKKAEELYTESLAIRPDYAYALAGLGRLAMKNGKYTEGVSFFEKAASQTADFDFQEKMIDCLEKIDPTKAKLAAQNLITELQKHATDEKAAAEKGHYADKELAYIYLKLGDTKMALEHATREWMRRPENIEANECLAWVYFQKNEFAQAKMYIERALKTKSKDPVLLERAAMIAAKN
jgi:tetratricopeptide (TPR) repeat protein